MDEKSPYKYHPIQIIDVKVLALHYDIKEGGASENSSTENDRDNSFNLYKTYSDYDTDDKTFVVKIKAEFDRDPNEHAGYKLIAELGGIFKVDESNFDIKYIESFAERNAPLVLYPYLREQVFGLAARAGIDPPILPLFEVPQFRVEKDSVDD